MTTKTLGHVLYEADNIGRERYMKPYDTLCESTKQEFEASASAVAEVVREQCAQVCEVERVSECDASDGVYNTATEHCAAAIRSMKL